MFTRLRGFFSCVSPERLNVWASILLEVCFGIDWRTFCAWLSKKINKIQNKEPGRAGPGQHKSSTHNPRQTTSESKKFFYGPPNPRPHEKCISHLHFGVFLVRVLLQSLLNASLVVFLSRAGGQRDGWRWFSTLWVLKTADRPHWQIDVCCCSPPPPPPLHPLARLWWIFSTLLMKIFPFVLFSFDFAACSEIYVLAGILARLRPEFTLLGG